MSTLINKVEGLVLLFLGAVEKGPEKSDRLTHHFSGGVAVADRALAPKAGRVAVWRRDRGKCAKCGNSRQLQFEHIVSPRDGGRDTVENLQLLCEKCIDAKTVAR